MQVTQKNLSDTNVQLTLVADEAILTEAKREALEHLAESVRLQGFRKGKAPLNMVEKSVDPSTLQTEFLDIAMNRLYVAALDDKNLRPVSQPKVNVKKFVPFDSLEIDVEVEVVGEIKLADYKKMKIDQPKVTVTAKDVDEVIENLLEREAARVSVERAVKDGDEVILSFKGVDTDTKEPISGADGKDYPLLIGSNTFIPGFEPNLVGMKPGDEKTFDIVFPKDYGVAALQSRKVTFTVTVSKVSEIQKSKLDDAFAAKAGPFKTVADLKEDIKNQLQSEKEYQADREFTDNMLMKIADASTVAIPQVLVDEQIDRMVSEQKQNLMYRGQTWQEFLDSEGLTEEEFRTKLEKDAKLRVKAGLVLSEVAEVEKVTVTPEELEVRMQLLKGQYSDPQMQAELDKPENRRDIVSRILSEKTLAKLRNYVTTATKPAESTTKKTPAKKAKK
ncbi:MAG TPA: trigger factor [Candidatus Saccharimonadales bacterium]|nr:trigger factor [Candidatus Saccharimonadales bacterium]